MLTWQNLAISDNQFPILNYLLIEGNANYLDSRLIPTVINDVTEITEANKAYIVTGTASADADGVELVSNDVYFKNQLINDYKLFKSIDQYSRVFGIKLASVSKTLIDTNAGKVSATDITNLSASGGYIGTNNGIDINPTITLSEGSIYGANNGLVIYAKWIISSVNAIYSTIDVDGTSTPVVSTGDIRLAIIKNNT